MTFTSPIWLLLLPLALLPLLIGAQQEQGYPSLAAFAPDRISTLVSASLKLAGVLALVGLVFGIAGLSLRERTIQRLGQGSHVVLLIDRSSSMDDTFAGRTPDGSEESKSGAAKRLLTDFIKERQHDRFGVVGFSTAPIQIVPITDHKEVVLAAIDAIDRKALAFTDVGRGLGMAVDMLEEDASEASRAIVLVSDGAAVIGRRVQESLRTEFARRPVHLYWLYLRTAGTNGIFEPPPPGTDDTPQASPERHLHKFFQSLNVPYRAFEAENADAIKSAIVEIGKLEQMPLVYQERVPQYDLSRWAYAAAVAGLLGLLLAKLCERSLLGSPALKGAPDAS